jgi:hypothetical protein
VACNSAACNSEKQRRRVTVANTFEPMQDLLLPTRLLTRLRKVDLS